MAKKTTTQKKKAINMEAMLVKLLYIERLKDIHFNYKIKGIQPSDEVIKKTKDIVELINVLDTIT